MGINKDRLGLTVRLTKYEEQLHRDNPKDSAYFDSMMARFNRMMASSGVTRDIKSGEFYEKPSDIRRRKQREADIRYKRKKEEENALHKRRSKKRNRRANTTSDRPVKASRG